MLSEPLVLHLPSKLLKLVSFRKVVILPVSRSLGKVGPWAMEPSDNPIGHYIYAITKVLHPIMYLLNHWLIGFLALMPGKTSTVTMRVVLSCFISSHWKKSARENSIKPHPTTQPSAFLLMLFLGMDHNKNAWVKCRPEVLRGEHLATRCSHFRTWLPVA